MNKHVKSKTRENKKPQKCSCLHFVLLVSDDSLAPGLLTTSGTWAIVFSSSSHPWGPATPPSFFMRTSLTHHTNCGQDTGAWTQFPLEWPCCHLTRPAMANVQFIQIHLKSLFQISALHRSTGHILYQLLYKHSFCFVA